MSTTSTTKGRPMDEDRFVEQAQQDEPVADFLTGIADDVRDGPPPKRFGVGFPDPMQIAVAYAVWSLMKLGIATLRTLIGLELAKRTSEVVDFLIAKGYPREIAEKIVKATQESLLKQSDDSPILQALLKLLPGSSPSLPPKPDPNDDADKEDDPPKAIE